MIDPLKRLIIKILRIPPEPENPLGEEGSLMIFRAAPNFYHYRLFLWAISALGTVIGSLVVIVFLETAVASQLGHAHPLVIILGFLLLFLACLNLVFSYAMVNLDYEMRWYKITDRSLRIREGIWFVREMTMTFANIQNIEISQGPLQRVLGIADLRVQTAGGGAARAPEGGKQNPYMFSMHDGYFRGVNNATEIRDIMRERLKRYRDAGLGDHEDHRPAASPQPASAPVSLGADLHQAVASLRQEASAFRAAAERAAARGGA